MSAVSLPSMSRLVSSWYTPLVDGDIGCSEEPPKALKSAVTRCTVAPDSKSAGRTANFSSTARPPTTTAGGGRTHRVGNRIRLASDTGSWLPIGTFGQYQSVYSLRGSASVVVVCEDILCECGSFLVVEHWRDIEVHERIPLAEIAI